MLRLAFSLWLIAFGKASSQDPYTLKLDVPVVSIDVTVLDGKDNLVNSLTKDDFLIYENGSPQDVRFFSSVSAPYNVFLLFDSSPSTRGNRNFMRSAVAGLFDNLRPQDSIAIGSFDRDFKVSLRWTTDRTKAAAALETIMRQPEGDETRFYGALDRTLRREFKGVVGRRAVVVLTDGQDTPLLYESSGDLRRALQSTREQRIPVYIVALKNQDAPPVIFPSTLVYLKEVQFNMQRFADNSGGEMLFPQDLSDVARLYEQIGRRLGTAYSLGYVSSNKRADATFRKIEVKMRNGSFRLIQSRQGYTLSSTK